MFVKELEITLENGMKISGELDLPERQGQWKTIILFHGSGPSDRHATVRLFIKSQCTEYRNNKRYRNVYGSQHPII